MVEKSREEKEGEEKEDKEGGEEEEEEPMAERGTAMKIQIKSKNKKNYT